ncbi:hypothetical protein GOB94_01485 [Granulicella sp. 5B5]|uniref:FliH/SctL family protein n=1 Tax=Granulicella sp. 5B5 TaxID=1617967 RepID=UPI0015F68DBF|nr:FliH/SctL family protein [Granulicella sp. 5B5]QMV17524.1 hypothetical protein GOB94_01485 [Granulicella sp. 5B5]
MMNISSNASDEAEYPFIASPLNYRDVSEQMPPDEAQIDDGSVAEEKVDAPISSGPTPEEVDTLLAKSRSDAIHETEEKMRMESDRALLQAREAFLRSLEAFAESRKDYFATVETEVIRLALAIAAKILHRESSADPMLVAAMVRIELDKLQAGSKVVLHVPAENQSDWVLAMSQLPRNIQAEVVGDAHLKAGDCVLQAEVGSVDLGIDAQLMNVEQSFLELLSKRPAK